MLKPLLCSFEQEQDLEKVKQRAKRAKKQLDTTLKSTKEMLANLRDVSREQSLMSEPESFGTLLKECLEEKFLTSDLTLKFTYDFKHGRLLAIDREKVKRVLNNALQNILTAVNPGANIEIRFASSRVKDGFTEISIKNTGSSCAPESLMQVFQAGYSSHGDELNQGVGAAIIKKFVELHGESVRADSSVAEDWFSIHFSLPCSSEVDDRPSELSENCHELSVNASKGRAQEIEALEANIQAYCLKNEKKLVIVALDDVEEHLHHLRTMLFASGKLRGKVELLTFTNTQALKYVDLKMIDLVITDLDFAGEADGLDLIRDIRAKGFKMPICAHSDYGINKAKEVYQAGADFIFEKPVFYEHLLKFVNECC